MPQKTTETSLPEPDPTPMKEELALPSSKAGIIQLFQSLTLFQKLEAYASRLKKAQTLTGELKLRVLRNVLRRLVRFQHQVDLNLQQNITLLEQTYAFYDNKDAKESEEEENQEMAGYCALYLAKLDGIRATWEEIITQQHEENLLRLETLLKERDEN